jgi:hypothetical protein
MKIILNETQLKKLVKGMSKTQLNEGLSDDYSKIIKTYFYTSGVTYKGKEILDIERPTIRVAYGIEIEAREWGIKDISLFGISGENELEINIEYWIDDDNSEMETTRIPINWDILKTENNSGNGIVTIGDELEITLGNDENGNLIITEMSLPIYTL